jgi:hypothetical protein
MELETLDNPLIRSVLFHPRPARPGGSGVKGAVDGLIPVEGSIALGYRLYSDPASKAVIVYFHGNGEIAPEYDDIAPLYWKCGASLLVIDYRGYGWSTGSPSFVALVNDLERVHAALPDLLKANGLDGKLRVLMGRSLGSACAIHLAHTHQAEYAALIIESGFAGIGPLLARLGLPVGLLGFQTDPVGNETKIAQISLPLLVIHGNEDTLIPVDNGLRLYVTSPAQIKTLARIEGAGHNDLLFHAEEYFEAVVTFLSQI